MNGVFPPTIDTVTGVTLLDFGYDAAGKLETLTDFNGDVTVIDRSVAGEVTGRRSLVG